MLERVGPVAVISARSVQMGLLRSPLDWTRYVRPACAYQTNLSPPSVTIAWMICTSVPEPELMLRVPGVGEDIDRTVAEPSGQGPWLMSAV